MVYHDQAFLRQCLLCHWRAEELYHFQILEKVCQKCVLQQIRKELSCFLPQPMVFSWLPLSTCSICLTSKYFHECIPRQSLFYEYFLFSKSWSLQADMLECSRLFKTKFQLRTSPYQPIPPFACISFLSSLTSCLSLFLPRGSVESLLHLARKGNWPKTIHQDLGIFLSLLQFKVKWSIWRLP